MILNDREMRILINSGELTIDPMDDSQIQPSSIDLRMGNFARVVIGGDETIDLANKEHLSAPNYQDIEIPKDGYVIPPKGAIIVQTAEYLGISELYQGMIQQKSGLVRAGVQVTSSICNPGFKGTLPCLVVNTTDRPVRVHQGMPFCQLSLAQLPGTPEIPYGEKRNSKYQGEKRFSISRISEEIRRHTSIDKDVDDLRKESLERAENEGLL